MASDIDKEEEALRAGMVERCELTLQSRLEPPTLTKDTSIGMYVINSFPDSEKSGFGIFSGFQEHFPDSVIWKKTHIEPENLKKSRRQKS